MIISSNLVDSVVLLELGERIARQRIRANLTQNALAQEAGISKRTLERIESGESTQLTNFIRVLRALDQLDKMELLLPPANPGPMEYLDYGDKKRFRARARKEEGKRPWIWGEDK